ncbi:hypothetical protein K1719_046044 [Acacia pycnantha]|nr:hypothetical protein K1719_046044 [Acacia pycnantha]
MVPTKDPSATARIELMCPYVMKHIYDIVTEGKTKFGAKRFACEKPFDDDEVEHIRHVFCEYLYKLVLEKLSEDNN